MVTYLTNVYVVVSTPYLLLASFVISIESTELIAAWEDYPAFFKKRWLAFLLVLKVMLGCF